MELITLRAKAPIIALQNPHFKRKPGTILAASQKINAFKINRNNPNVKIMKGKAKIPKMGFKTAFKIPKVAAAIKALPILSISTPRGSQEIIRKAIVVTIQAIIISILFGLDNTQPRYIKYRPQKIYLKSGFFLLSTKRMRSRLKSSSLE
jgi:hypothetical protein